MGARFFTRLPLFLPSLLLFSSSITIPDDIVAPQQGSSAERPSRQKRDKRSISGSLLRDKLESLYNCRRRRRRQ